MRLTANMGTTDRLLRTFALAPGAVAGALVLGPTSGAGIALWVVAAIMLATSAVGFCPLYVPFGLRTTGGRHHGGPTAGRTDRPANLARSA